RRVETVLAAIDRGTGEPGDPRDDREPAPSGGAHLASRKQPPAALIKRRADRFPAIANGVLVDHATDLRLFAPAGNPSHLSHTAARPQSAILLLSRMSLGCPATSLTQTTVPGCSAAHPVSRQRKCQKHERRNNFKKTLSHRSRITSYSMALTASVSFWRTRLSPPSTSR